MVAEKSPIIHKHWKAVKILSIALCTSVRPKTRSNFGTGAETFFSIIETPKNSNFKQILIFSLFFDDISFCKVEIDHRNNSKIYDIWQQIWF